MDLLLPFPFVEDVQPRGCQRFACGEGETHVTAFRDRVESWGMPVAIWMYVWISVLEMRNEKLIVADSDGTAYRHDWYGGHIAVPARVEKTAVDWSEEELDSLIDALRQPTEARCDGAVFIPGDARIRAREVLMYRKGSVARFYFQPGEQAEAWFGERGTGSVYSVLYSLYAGVGDTTAKGDRI